MGKVSFLLKIIPMIKDAIKLRNSEETSQSVTIQSPLLVGDFGKKSGPSIISIIADDPDNSDDSYSVGDTIAIEFSDATNTPFYDGVPGDDDSRLAGIDPIAVSDLKNTIRSLNKKNIGVLISDHNVRDTMNICSKVLVVNKGKIIASGLPEEIAKDDLVREVYLGQNFISE